MTQTGLGDGYALVDDPAFEVRYAARCRCGTVRYEVGAAPLDAKLCHCRDCQVLHGAPMQWAAIFRKQDVRLTRGAEHLVFYNVETGDRVRRLPCKVSCGRCGTPIADEGRNMWLAFPTLFEFGTPARIPDAFRPTCHIFYESRVVDVADDLPRWAGHKNRSERLP